MYGYVGSEYCRKDVLFVLLSNVKFLYIIGKILFMDIVI